MKKIIPDSLNYKKLLSRSSKNEKELDEGSQESLNSLLFIATWEGDIEQVNIALRRKADINAIDRWGNNPLHCAIKNRHYDIAKYLINNGAEVNNANNNGNTPLHEASLNNDYKIIDLLITNGANINAKDNYGNKPNVRNFSSVHRDNKKIVDNLNEISAKSTNSR